MADLEMRDFLLVLSSSFLSSNFLFILGDSSIQVFMAIEQIPSSSNVPSYDAAPRGCC